MPAWRVASVFPCRVALLGANSAAGRFWFGARPEPFARGAGSYQGLQASPWVINPVGCTPCTVWWSCMGLPFAVGVENVATGWAFSSECCQRPVKGISVHGMHPTGLRSYSRTRRLAACGHSAERHETSLVATFRRCLEVSGP
jgi:hypothetical protein